MTLLLALLDAALLAAAPVSPQPTSPVEAAVSAAVEAARGSPSAHAEVLEVEGSLPAGCALTRVEVPRPVVASGRIATRLVGSGPQAGGCDRWAWARVRVTAPALVTDREVPEGAPLEGAVRTEQREVLTGRSPLEVLPEGATSTRQLPASTPLDDALVRVGPRPGEPVTVVLRAGALSVERQARSLPCRRGRVCALLPSGKRLEGDWHGGRIEVELP